MFGTQLEELWGEERRADDAAMRMKPEVRPRPRLIALTQQTLLDMGAVTSPDHLTSINLHGNGLMRLRGLSALRHLRNLIVSFNELQVRNPLASFFFSYLSMALVSTLLSLLFKRPLESELIAVC